MGHHINKNGEFQSDKYPDLKPNKIIISFKDPAGKIALREYAKHAEDKELGRDILRALNNLKEKEK